MPSSFAFSCLHKQTIFQIDFQRLKLFALIFELLGNYIQNSESIGENKVGYPTYYLHAQNIKIISGQNAD